MAKTINETRGGFKFIWTNHPKNEEISVEAIHVESGVSVMDWGYPYMGGVRGFFANLTLWGDQALIEAKHQHEQMKGSDDD